MKNLSLLGTEEKKQMPAKENSVFHHFVPNEILCQIFSNFLSIHDVSLFDIAMCNRAKRPPYLKCIGSKECLWLGDKKTGLHPHRVSWISKRNMDITHLKCCSAVDDMAISFDTFGSSLQWLSLFEKRDRTQYECYFEERQVNSDVDRKITDQGMIRIIESCPNLKHLYMDLKSKNITDNISLSLAKFCTDLQSLEMSNCLYITDIGLVNIAEGCRSIQTLNLSNCTRIGDIGVIRIAECSPNLLVLDLTYCWEITNNCMIRIAENCPNLETLILSDCERITDISSIPISCPNLQSLDLSLCRGITANCLINISECHNLRILDVSEIFQVEDTIVMRILEGCSKLESLTMHECILMSHNGKIKIAKRYPNLKCCSKWENIAAKNKNDQMMFEYFEGDYGDH